VVSVLLGHYVMSESFAELFEESLNNTQMRPGSIVKGTVVEVGSEVVVVNAGLKSEGIIPVEQFKNDAGEIEVNVGDEVDVASRRSKTVSVPRAFRAKRPNAPNPGPAWRRRTKRTRPLSVVSSTRSRAVSPSRPRISAPSCPAPWSMCVRYVTPPTSRARTSSSR
jgi:hypothetical protein